MDVPRLVRTHITTGELNLPQELVNALNDGSTALSEIVKSLGEYLTSIEDDVRLKGVTFLSNLVQVIKPARFNRPATQTLTSFFLSKLDDFDSLPPALRALTLLSKLPTFDDGIATEVYRGIVEQVKLKSYVQATRHLAYILLDSLLALHRKALKDMGAEFLNSYTQLVDGEKDPRNLMLLFSMDRVILLEFDVADHMEDFFDVTFCYFPIMFKPPPNDPYGITADDLKLALRKCMATSPRFAKMALALFLEKFAMATGAAMTDLMLSMAACFPVYGADAVRERGTELWEGIKTEIMYSSDSSIEAAALSALESLIRTLYPMSDDVPSGLAQDIIKQCLDILQEPEKNQAIAATKTLAALIRASHSAGTFSLSQSLPQLFRQFNRPALPSHRTPILSSIASLLYACRTVYGTADATRNQKIEKSLEPFRESLMDVLREGLRTDDLKTPAIKGSVALAEIPGFWVRDEVEDIVKGMNEILVNVKDQANRSTAVQGLTSISRLFPDTVEAVTLPLLFHNLPDRAPPIGDIDGRDKYRSILGSLSELCVQPVLFTTLIIRITTKLDLLSATPVPPTPSQNDTAMEVDGSTLQDDTRECDVAYTWDLLSCLSGVIESKIRKNHVDVSKHFDQIIPRLYGLVVVAAAPRVGDVEPLFRNRRLLSIIGNTAETLMWELTIEQQAKHLAAVYAAFERGEMSGIVFESSAVKALSGSPLRHGASSSEQNLIAIYASSFQGARAQCSDPSPSPEAFLSSKIRWTIHEATNSFQVKSALDLIAAYVNKRDKSLKDVLGGILELVWIQEVVDTAQPFDIRQRALLVYLHVVKALSLLRDPLAYEAVDRVVSVLKLSNFDPVFVDEAAKSFGVLAAGKGKSPGKPSHLTSKLLYAQKLWNHVLAQLIDGDKEATGRHRLPYLVAFSSLLPLVPASLCLSDLSTLLPLLLRSLALPEAPQRVNAAKTLISILETQNMSADVDSLLHSHATAMVSSLLQNALPDTTGTTVSSGKVREVALRCLSLVPDAIRFDTLRSIKSETVKELGKALDDPLRVVRREAVECRAKWYRYGGTS